MSLHFMPSYVKQRFANTLSPWNYDVRKDHVIYTVEPNMVLKIFNINSVNGSAAFPEPLRLAISDVAYRRQNKEAISRSDVELELEGERLITQYHANVAQYLRVNGVASPLPLAVLRPSQTAELFNPLKMTMRRIGRQLVGQAPESFRHSLLEEKLPMKPLSTLTSKEVSQYILDIDYIRRLGFEPADTSLMHGKNVQYIKAQGHDDGLVAFFDFQYWRPITDETRALMHQPIDSSNPLFSYPRFADEAQDRTKKINAVLSTYADDKN
ncbi:MAG TPA: hypothetical protein VK158_05355 [Acidobacteriota bacterium]|nr:hypothetical protein [Acidobacteriota bacterium]